MIRLLITLGLLYLGIIHLGYFLFNPLFDNKIIYKSIYLMKFDLKETSHAN